MRRDGDGGLPHSVAAHLGDHELVQRPRGAGGALAMASLAFVRTEMVPAEAPPRRLTGVVAWLQKNLFATPADTVLTILGALFLIWILPPLYGWFLGNAVWPGGTVEQCRLEVAGACWAYIGSEIEFFLYGFYPLAETWRVNIFFLLLAVLLVPLLVPKAPFKLANAILFFVVFPIVSVILLLGRYLRPEVRADRVLGRPDGHPDRLGRRHLLLAADRHRARARPPLQAAGLQDPLRRLHRARPRGAADLDPLHGLDHAAAVHAAGHDGRQIPPRARRRVAVLGRLHGRGGARWPPGDSARPVRGGVGARPWLLEIDVLHHPAAGAEARDPGDREQLHLALQGHLARLHRGHEGPARCGEDQERHRPRVAVGSDRHHRLRLRRPRLLAFLFLHVALLAVHGAPAQHRPQEVTL